MLVGVQHSAGRCESRWGWFCGIFARFIFVPFMSISRPELRIPCVVFVYFPGVG